MEKNQSVTRVIFCKTLLSRGPQAGCEDQWGGKIGGTFTTITQHKDRSHCNNQQSVDGVFLKYLFTLQVAPPEFLCLRRSGFQTWAMHQSYLQGLLNTDCYMGGPHSQTQPLR